MRAALLPLAIAAGTVAWNFQSVAMADEEPRRGREFKVLLHKDTWAWLLASPALDPQERSILARLAPYLEIGTYRALSPRQRTFLVRYAANRIGGTSPLARCWAPGTPEHLLRAYHAVEEAAQAEAPHAPRMANQFFRRWGRTATNGPGQSVQGRPITLTWSIVPDGTPIPSEPTIGDSDDPSNLRARLAEIYGGDTGPPENQPWFPIIRNVFENIAAKTGINYVYEPSDDGARIGSTTPGRLRVRGDIRLGGHDIDGDRGTLAYSFFPDKGDTVFDTGDNWYSDTFDNSIRLANTFEHEHGHALGMQHVCPSDNTKLMEPFINSNFRGIQFDDLYTLQRWYGDFYEQDDRTRDNDSFDSAAPLPVSPGSPFRFEWLSVDGSRDVDYFSLTIPPDSQVTVRVTPASGAYPEGPQNADGTCSSGIPFDPGLQQDLTLELIGPDRSTVLASSTTNPIGQREEIVDFASPRNGTHYLRVDGDANDRAQLYRLEIELAAPSVAIALQSTTIVAESFAPANGAVEPGETIEVELGLINSGSLEARQVQATLSGPAGFTSFGPAQTFGHLAPSARAARKFVFALEGDCGESIPLALTVTADRGYHESIPLGFSLGTTTTTAEESFDAADEALPAGWTSSHSEDGSGWHPSAARASSPRYSLSARNTPRIGTSTLTSPSFTLGPLGGTLRFRHYFHTEATASDAFDGGVLEISTKGGPWQDVLEGGATFTRGEYNRTLSRRFENPLGGRRSWSGHSGGWITTEVALPPSLGDEPLRFRWRLAHDVSEAEEGWYLDDFKLTSTECANTAPLVTLSLDDPTASEFAPLDRGRLTFTTALPPLSDLTIPLVHSGTATPGLDLTGLEHIVLPAGQTSVDVELIGVHDTEVEGEESLVLSIDPASGLLAGGPPTATITISDTPYGDWAATTLGLGSANRPLEDHDGDGSPNLEEYAWQTDGASPVSLPDLAPRLKDGSLRIDAPVSTLPGDVFVRAESSLDLQSWTPEGIEALADGFQLPTGDPERYLRLVYRLIPAAP